MLYFLINSYLTVIKLIFFLWKYFIFKIIKYFFIFFVYTYCEDYLKYLSLSFLFYVKDLDDFQYHSYFKYDMCIYQDYLYTKIIVFKNSGSFFSSIKSAGFTEYDIDLIKNVFQSQLDLLTLRKGDKLSILFSQGICDKKKNIINCLV